MERALTNNAIKTDLFLFNMRMLATNNTFITLDIHFYIKDYLILSEL